MPGSAQLEPTSLRRVLLDDMSCRRRRDRREPGALAEVERVPHGARRTPLSSAPLVGGLGTSAMRSGRTVNGSGAPRNRMARSPETTFDVPTNPATNAEAGVVDLRGRADLLDPTVVEHRDAVAHRERFLLVVGDEDERDADLVLYALELDLHLLAQLQVERAERFVEQEHPRPVHQRARERDPLALSARQLVTRRSR